MQATGHEPIRVEEHLRMAYHVVNRYRRRARRLGLDVDDLAQVACLAMVSAAATHDPARSSWSTHAFLSCEWGVRGMLKRSRPLARLPVDGDGNLLVEPEAEAEPDPLVSAKDAELLARLLVALPDRERLAVRLRFGLGGGDKRSHQEIGAELGVSVPRAQQIVSRAIRRMREMANRQEQHR